MLSQKIVFNFLFGKKDSALIKIVLLVYDRSNYLTQKQLIGLIMASIALGGDCW